MDPFPLLGIKNEKAKSAVPFFIIELEIYRNMHVNPEIT